MTAAWRGGGRWECTLANRAAGRAVQFDLVVGDTSVEYTPTKIDVPDEVKPEDAMAREAEGEGEPQGCVLSEAVTEAIEFDRTMLPVFLSKLVEELFV
jgi:hypothetical protein